MGSLAGRLAAAPLSALYWLVGAAAAAWYRVCLPFAGGERRRLVAERLGRWPAAAVSTPASVPAPAPTPGRRALSPMLGARAPGAPAPERVKVWVHAASVGEVAVARPLLRALQAAGARIILTTNTTTGQAGAVGEGVDEIRYFPVDWPPILKRVFSRAEARLLILVETELWPGLLAGARARGVPVVVINARLSDRSWPRYRRLRAALAPAMVAITAVCAREEVSAGRWRELGVAPGRVTVVGDLKFDALSRAAVAATPDLLAGLHADAAVLVAASTHDGEEAAVLDALVQVRAAGHRSGLVLAPRHPERADAVEALVRERGLACVRWSRSRGAVGSFDVLLLDTVGDLRGFLAGARAVFVGGTLVSIGGHNVLEPAAFGAPVLVGPYTANVTDTVVALAQVGALEEVADVDGLARAWAELVADPDEARRRGAAGARLVAGSGGALTRTMAVLRPVLDAARRSADGGTERGGAR